MFTTVGRVWPGRPAADAGERRLRVRHWLWSGIDRLVSPTRDRAQDVPAALGASDGELVQVATRRALDGAEQHRHQAMMLLLTQNGNRRQ